MILSTYISIYIDTCIHTDRHTYRQTDTDGLIRNEILRCRVRVSFTPNQAFTFGHDILVHAIMTFFFLFRAEKIPCQPLSYCKINCRLKIYHPCPI